MTTPDRRILSLASLVLLLVVQVAPATALCTCSSPCDAEAAAPAADPSDACCSETAAPPGPSLEGVCCMADGENSEIQTVVALPGPTSVADGADAPTNSLATEHSRVGQSDTRVDVQPRTHPPAPPPVILMTECFLN